MGKYLNYSKMVRTFWGRCVLLCCITYKYVCACEKKAVTLPCNFDIAIIQPIILCNKNLIS